ALASSQTRRWSGDPAAFDRHGASTTPPDVYFDTSPGLNAVVNGARARQDSLIRPPAPFTSRASSLSADLSRVTSKIPSFRPQVSASPTVRPLRRRISA